MSVAGENILVRSVNWLGDAVMTTPALRRLREARPKARITILTPAKLAELWRHHPCIDAVLGIEEGEGLWDVASKLRSASFDTALIFPNSIRTAMEAWLARIPCRIGLATNGRSLLLTKAINRRPGARRMRKRSLAEVRERIATKAIRESFPTEAHHVHDYLHLVAALGGSPSPVPPVLGVSNAELAEVRGKFGFNGKFPLVGLNPGAEYGPAKRWPEQRFRDVAVRLYQETGCGLAIFGGKADVEACERIAEGITKEVTGALIINLAGRTSVRELCSALRLCDVLVSNDTGPMHVAAALGTPVVVPFGSTSWELTGPGIYGSQHQMLFVEAACAPCFLRECPVDARCLRDIGADQAVSAVRRVLALPRVQSGL